MRYEYEAVGPIAVAAKMRSSDLTVTASESAAQVLVTVEPRRGGDEVAQATRVEMVGGRLEIVVPKVVSGLFRSSGSVHVEAIVPSGSSLEVESGSGDVRTSGQLGAVEARAGSGDVAVADAGRLHVTAGSGDVTVESAEQVKVTSGSGDVKVGRVATGAELRSGSGDIAVQETTDLHVTTGSGDAIIGATAGFVEMSTGSGDLLLRRASEGEVHAKSASGDVVVGVATGTAALLDCTSVSGRVSSDLEAGDAPGEAEKGVVLRLRSVSGDVRVGRG